ncbi:MAG: acyl-CoA carboxylase subunit beta [Solirubrobacteraceae bacterium]|nr:MAG: methylmalonyl-CoA carboxyltransferase [Solirubrobacterales bacterium]
MGWERELAELRRREALAHAMGGAERIERQHARGSLTVRERIERLFDRGSFHESGALAGAADYDAEGELATFTPANMVVGHGRIDGRTAVIQGDDFTVRGGAADAAIWQKMVHAERLAHDLRVPLVRLVDGTGGGGSVKHLEQHGFTYVPFLPGFDLVVENLARVPVAAAALGPCAGLGAARVVASHFSVIVRGAAQLFVAGPPVVAAAMGEAPDKEELGGARTQAAVGAIDNIAEDDEDALDQLRRFLSFLPANAWEPPPRVDASDPPDRREQSLLEIVPRDRRKPYAVRELLAAICDRGSLFEIGARAGRSVVCALARLDGVAVGVSASDPRFAGGGLTGDASDKLVRFIDLCDQFRLPIVNVVDQPGFVIGTAAERVNTVRRGVRALFALYQTEVPTASLIVRKAFGIAGAALAGDRGGAGGLQVRFAWPSGDWGSLPVEGGIEAAYRRELEAATDPLALRAEIAARLDAVRSPFRSAERFSIEEIIDPRDSRPLLCDWARNAHVLVARDAAGGPRARGPRA